MSKGQTKHPQTAQTLLAKSPKSMDVKVLKLIQGRRIGSNLCFCFLRFSCIKPWFRLKLSNAPIFQRLRTCHESSNAGRGVEAPRGELPFGSPGGLSQRDRDGQSRVQALGILSFPFLLRSVFKPEPIRSPKWQGYPLVN